MTDLLDQMEGLLTDLLRSGYRTVSDGTLDAIRTAGANCEAAGLHTASALMISIADQLQSRRSTLQKNDLDLTDTLCRTVRYIELCRERLTEDAIRERWKQGGSL